MLLSWPVTDRERPAPLTLEILKLKFTTLLTLEGVITLVLEGLLAGDILAADGLLIGVTLVEVEANGLEVELIDATGV